MITRSETHIDVVVKEINSIPNELNVCDERGVRKVLIKPKVHIDRLPEHRKSPVYFQLVELIRV